MNNPQYFRLLSGFKRIVVEYLPAGANQWQLEPIDCDDDESIRLSKEPVGIATLKRPRIKTKKE